MGCMGFYINDKSFKSYGSKTVIVFCALIIFSAKTILKGVFL